MKNYTSLLGLNFDPFEPGARSRDFFFTQSSKQLLEEVFELSIYSDSIISITGPLGCGKSTLIGVLADSYGEEALCIEIKATLFMNQLQFLEALMERLTVSPASSGDLEQSLDQLQQHAGQMDLDAKSLVLIVDDAHELSAEVHQLLREILKRCSCFHGILLGESQLENMLRSTLNEEDFDNLARFEVLEFGGEEVIQYIRFKLETAGYDKAVPLAGPLLGELINRSNGIPGTINALVADALENSLEEQTEPTDKEGTNILAAVAPTHWAVAAGLLVLLVAILVFWDSSPEFDPSADMASGDRSRVQIPVNIAASDREEDIREVEQPLSAVAASAAIDSTAVEASDGAVDQPVEEPVQSAAQSISQSTLQSTPQLNPQSNPQTTPPTTSGSSQAVAVEPQEVSEISQASQLSVFESELMSQAAQSFTIQLLGSRSEDNVRNFISSNDRQGMGYFQTVYQRQPWFVVILGNFGNRASASETIDSLPQSLRSLQPWVRAVSDIQSEISQSRNL